MPAGRGSALLLLRGVSKRYRDGDGGEIAAVSDVSLTLDAGEMVALQGPSGSGKTTLLLLIARLLAPDGGEIEFDGRPLAGFSERQANIYLQREVGFVYQAPQLMAGVPVVENVAIKLLLAGMSMPQARRRARQWLERVGLADAAPRDPSSLSAGERQRVALARALVCEPRLILADEPTGNLDSARSRQVISLLAELAREASVGVVLVTHDRDAAALADRDLSLRDGRLSAAPVAAPHGASRRSAGQAQAAPDVALSL